MKLIAPKQEKNGIFSLLRRERPLALIVFLVTVLYAFLNCMRQSHFQTGGFDLGIFDQATWNLSQGRPPACTVYVIPNILEDHFEPILFLLAPLYWLCSKVQVLFFAQSFAVALSAIAVFQFAERRLGRKPAYLWTIAYSSFWGIQALLAYDFHPVGLAVPMIAFAIEFMDRKKWWKVFACLLLLLTVKEDLPLLILFFGFYLWICREWGKGLLCIMIGSGTFVFLVGYLMPHLSGKPYIHWIYPELGKTMTEAVPNVLGHPWLILKIWFSNPEKILTTFYAFLASLGMAFFSPLLVLAIPLFAEKMLSIQEPLWSMGYHYSAAISPILLMAGVDGLHRLTLRFQKPEKAKRFISAVSWTVMVLNLLSITVYPTKDLYRWKFYRFKQCQVIGPKVLSLIPPDAKVLAQDSIVPHLSHRQYIYDLQPGANIGMDCDYFVTCSELRTWPFDGFEGIQQEREKRMKEGYKKVFEGEGWLILKK